MLIYYSFEIPNPVKNKKSFLFEVSINKFLIDTLMYAKFK